MQSNPRTSEGTIRYEGGSNPLPLQGTDTAEILINDHVVIKGLLDRLCNAHDPAAQQTCLEQLKSALTIHNAMEENLVYPALREIAGKKKESQKLYQETAEADVVVFRLDTMLKTGETSSFNTTARTLQAAILEHIDDEEQDAIPDLRSGATREQANLLAQSCREFRSRF